MNRIDLPFRSSGSWIWLNSCVHSDSFLLFRKEFNCDSADTDVDLWISAHTAYQLFINERLIAFGPRGHAVPSSCYADLHNIGFFMQPGVNVIAVKVFYNTSGGAGLTAEHTPGFWCQAFAGKEQLFVSDETWDVMQADFFTGRRPRIAPEEGMTEIFHSENCPSDWNCLSDAPISSWRKPDRIIPADDFPLTLEPDPIPPPVILPESPAFSLWDSGRILSCPYWTGVCFNTAKYTNPDTFAAAGYIFAEEAAKVEVLLYSDDPFKLYCNCSPVSAGQYEYGREIRTLELVPGWNRLLLYQTPLANSMGFMMIFLNDNISVRQDTIGSADEGWCLTQPLRLTLAEATPSLRLERLSLTTCSCGIGDIPCIEELLKYSMLEKGDVSSFSGEMYSGDYCIWKLPETHYGFLRLKISGGIGDIVDVSVSTGFSNGFAGSEGRRSLGTLFCRGSECTYLLSVPDDCLFAGIFIRSSRSGVKIESIEFRPLGRELCREASFHSSDKILNQMWDAGQKQLYRTMSMIPLADSRASLDLFLFDAYALAVNAASGIGDGSYMTALLRQFLDSQLENGDIPALTHSSRRKQQLHHMFFLPKWILLNYSFTQDAAELESTLPALTFVREFFESMIEQDSGLLVFPEDWAKTDSRLSSIDFSNGRISCCLNALFCRFLLSTADVYRLSPNGRGEAAVCVKLAGRIAERLRETCKDAGKGLFYTWAEKEKTSDIFDCFSNFCAMYGGIMDPEDFETFFYTFFSYDPPFVKFDGMTPYFSFLFTEMMFACGQRQWSFRYMRDYWASRLDISGGSWRENNGVPARTALFNGTIVSPNMFLIKEVLGIRRSETENGVIFFHPGADFVESAEGTVPMHNGRLLVKWQRSEDGGLDVLLDSDVPVAIMPELSAEHLHKTSFQLSEGVTLLKPPEDFEDDLSF